MTRVALDSNILVYAELTPDEAKGQRSRALIAAAAADGVIAMQALAELLRVVQRKSADRLEGAIAQVREYLEFFRAPLTTDEVLLAGAAIARDHKLQLWDAVIVAASARAGAEVLLTEDLQDGRVVGGLRVINPFLVENAAAVEALFPI
jgi:predicted nucleic acid-binding protein